MRIAVCDDELTMLKLVSTLVRIEFEKRGENVVVSSYPNAEQLVRDLTQKKYDAVLLDILMPGIDGFEAARSIRKSSPDTKIVFITTEENLVYDSFDFQPFAFIPKTPPDAMRSRLSRTTEKLLDDHRANRKICIELPYNDKLYIKPHDLIYVNSEKNNIFYHLTNGETIIVRAKIKSAEEILPPDLFARIHNRIIVNMEHIVSMEYDRSFLVVTGGEALSISRSYKSEFDGIFNNRMKNLV